MTAENPNLIELKNKENRRFQYHFTVEESSKLGQELSNALEEKLSIENEKKEVMSDFKNRLDMQETVISTLTAKVGRGYEYRNKSVKILVDFDKKVRILIDSEGEIFGEEPLQDSDYQLRLNLDNAEADKQEEAQEQPHKPIYKVYHEQP